MRFNRSGAHYSVRYATAKQRKSLAALIKQNDPSIDPAQRLLTLNDSLMQSRAGVSSITDALELLAAFDTERHEPVWNVMSLCIADARRLVETNDAAENNMKRFVYRIVANLYEELGWNKKLRSL